MISSTSGCTSRDIVSDRFVERIEKKLAVLADAPGIGRQRDDLREGVRSYPLGNFLILYQPVVGGIEVLRVVHGGRNLPEIFDSN